MKPIGLQNIKYDLIKISEPYDGLLWEDNTADIVNRLMRSYLSDLIKDRYIVKYGIEYTRNENVSYTFDVGIQLEPNRTNKKIKVHVGVYKSNWPAKKKRKNKTREFA